ncbi:MAG TPA: DUF4397 domain-containing protein [Candidatus Acidoferrum sp.]|nr:DUF4397 domain-containing protein [Candidatus Acidoferrum sp.]
MIAACLGLAALAGCGPLNPGTIITTNGGNANVRVLQGSPDTPTVDAKLDGSTALTPSGGLAYGKFTGYASIASGSHSLAIYPTGQSTATFTCPLGVLNAGVGYTIVIAGKQAAGKGTSTGLQCQIFGEPAYPSVTSPQANISLHYASPAASAAGNVALSIGTFTPGTTTYNASVGASTFTAQTSGSAVSNGTALTITGVTTAPGVGFWVAAPPTSGSTPTSVLATILPSQGQAGASGSSGASDTGNIFPQSPLVNFAIYAIDAPAGATSPSGAQTPITLVGVFD